jgi:hypothetical protein
METRVKFYIIKESDWSVVDGTDAYTTAEVAARQQAEAEKDETFVIVKAVASVAVPPRKPARVKPLA